MIVAQVQAASDPQRARDALRTVERRAGCSVDDMTAGCLLLDVLENGQHVGAVALDVHGAEAVITAAACRGEATYHHLGLIEGMAASAGVRRLSMVTRRKALARMLCRRGYRIKQVHEGATALEKEL